MSGIYLTTITLDRQIILNYSGEKYRCNSITMIHYCIAYCANTRHFSMSLRYYFITADEEIQGVKYAPLHLEYYYWAVFCLIDCW